MSCITRCVLRWGLMSGLALGGLTMLVGPARVGAGLAQFRAHAQDVVDSHVGDPIALKRQLENLADEYPERIAEVRGELAEVSHQLGEIDEEVEVAQRVVAYTSEDLTVLQSRLAKADTAIQTRLASTGRSKTPPVFIRFEGVRFNIDEARSEAIRIGSVREQYRDRIATNDNQQKLLEQQRSRLSEILTKLETDFGTYQAKLWSLDRQIDAIERNEHLLALVKQHQSTMDGYDRYTQVASLKGLEAKLAHLQMEQEAQWDFYTKQGARQDYETKARHEIDAIDAVDAMDAVDMLEFDVSPTVHRPDTIAYLDPIIIDD